MPLSVATTQYIENKTESRGQSVLTLGFSLPIVNKTSVPLSVVKTQYMENKMESRLQIDLTLDFSLPILIYVGYKGKKKFTNLFFI